MREGNLYGIIEKQENRLAAIYRQLQFLDCRKRAFEQTFAKHPFKAIFSSQRFEQLVDEKQLELLKEHDDAMRKAMQEKVEKNKEAMIPKLILPSNGIEKLHG